MSLLSSERCDPITSAVGVKSDYLICLIRLITLPLGHENVRHSVSVLFSLSPCALGSTPSLLSATEARRRSQWIAGRFSGH